MTKGEKSDDNRQLAALAADLVVREAVACLDRSGRILYANRSAIKLAGLGPDGIFGADVGKLWKDLDWEGIWRQVSEREGSRMFIEYDHVTRDGHRCPLEVSFFIETVGGEEVAMVSARDISERRGLLESLRLYRNRSRKYFELAGLIYLVLKPNGEILDINQTGCRILGYGKEELIGRNWIGDFVAGEFREEAKRAQDRAIGDDGHVVFENRVLGKDGKEMTVVWHNTVLRDETGKVNLVLSAGTDMTESRKVEERARISERRLNTILNSLSVGVFRNVFDPKGRFTEVNPALVRMMEADSEEQVMSVRVGDLYWDFDKQVDFGRKILRDGFVRGYPMEMRTLKGKRIWVSMTATTVRGEDGLTYMDGIMEDITSRREAEESLRWQLEISQRLSKAAYGYISSGDYDRLIGSTLEAAGRMLRADRVCIATLSPDGKFIEYTHEWKIDSIPPVAVRMSKVPAERMAWSIDQARNGKIVRFDRENDMPKEAVFERNLVKEVGLKAMLVIPLFGEGQYGSMTFSRYSSDEVWGEQEIGAAELASGLLAGAISRQESAAELVESKKQMEDIVSHVNLGILQFDMTPPVRLVDFNEPTAKMMEAESREDLKDRMLDDILAEGREKGREMVEKIVRDGRLVRESLLVRSLKGREFWVELSGGLDPRRKGIFGGVISDITQRKETEGKVRELDSLKNTFIQVVSHQVRTPLNSIRWSLETLLSEELGKLTQSQKDFLRVVYMAETEILARLNDMLTALDIEENRVVFHRSRFSLDSVWSSVMPDISRRCRLKEISLNYEQADSDLNVDADAEKIREVITILSENAVDYTPNGGNIWVSLRRSGKGVRFEVRDSGIGIPESERGRIFSRFYRATNAPIMKPDATGLALAIARYHVEQHGGKIGFDSEEGKGSTFWFEIPAA
ncbi:PAS domain S-box protein [Candidatus Uhrbacteria bacterium]|nr:PAS domain S-box protein [Candidatus Uhrbacteria bacterium]